MCDLAPNPCVSTPFNEEYEADSHFETYPGLEKYTLSRKLGEGGFSEVFEAEQVQSRKRVAIKVIRKFQLSMKQRANVLKEAAIMRRISHKNIVGFRDFIEVEAFFYFILEMVDGGELFDCIIRYTYFSEDLARHVISQVANAVRYLHNECGVVHRDIKPENILFRKIPFMPTPPHRAPFSLNFEGEEKEDEGTFIQGIGGGEIGCIKLADFGFSKVVWSENTATPCGTVGYTAPEIVRDERYSTAVDIWALGCVMYTLLCGFPPFYDDSVDILTEKVAKGEYTFLSPWWDPVSTSAKHLITKMLDVDPKKRYTIDQVLEHPWIKNEPFHPELEDLSTVIVTVDDEVEPAVLSPVICPEHTHLVDSKLDLSHPKPQDAVATPFTPTPLHEDGVPAPHRMRGAFEVSMAVFNQLEENGAARLTPGFQTNKPRTPCLTTRKPDGYFELPPVSQRVYQGHPTGDSHWQFAPRSPFFINNQRQPRQPFGRARSNSLQADLSTTCAIENMKGVEKLRRMSQGSASHSPMGISTVSGEKGKLVHKMSTASSQLSGYSLTQNFDSLSRINRDNNTNIQNEPLLSELPFVQELRIQDSKLIQRRRGVA